MIYSYIVMIHLVMNKVKMITFSVPLGMNRLSSKCSLQGIKDNRVVRIV
jgi:hypothetical protein